jgi:hypothetical protein
MSGPLLGHGASVALAGVTNIYYVGNTYTDLARIRGLLMAARSQSLPGSSHGKRLPAAPCAALATATTTPTV